LINAGKSTRNLKNSTLSNTKILGIFQIADTLRGDCTMI